VRLEDRIAILSSSLARLPSVRAGVRILFCHPVYTCYPVFRIACPVAVYRLEDRIACARQRARSAEYQLVLAHSPSSHPYSQERKFGASRIPKKGSRKF